MENLSLSLHIGDTFSQDHNRRNFVSKNVDKSRMGENVYYDEGMGVREFYDKHFQKSYEEFLQKQIASGHGNRVKNHPQTYYELIYQKQLEQEAKKRKLRLDKAHKKEYHQQDRYQRVAKEMIVQFGTVDDLKKLPAGQETDLRERMKFALSEYASNFEKRNPGFKIVDYAIHMDEQGGPHLHLLFCPVVEMTRGQKVQNTLEGAYRLQGFTTDQKANEDGVWETAQMKWQTKERDYLVQLATECDLSVSYQKGKGRKKYLTIDEYKMQKDLERDARIKKAQAEVEKQKKIVAEKQKVIDQQNKQISSQQKMIQKQSDDIIAKSNRLFDIDKEIETAVEEGTSHLIGEYTEKLENLFQDAKERTEKVVDEMEGTGATAEEYKKAPLSRGARIVPEGQLQTLINQGRLQKGYLKKIIDDTFSRIHDFPAIRRMAETITNLKGKIISLQREILNLNDIIKSKDREISEQKKDFSLYKKVVYELGIGDKIDEVVTAVKQKERENREIADD